MKNLNFKNFNYSIINSAKEGYKEVLVTYEADNVPARKICFVREVKGKGNAYYISEAKKQIQSQISTGALAKSASEQIKHANSKGILKPTLITLAAVLGLGALGAGGYFTYKYFTNPGGGDVPPGPEPVVTGHTVVLFAGNEGKFKNNLNYLFLNNVPDQTTLGNVEGYEEPKPINSDVEFDTWAGPIKENTYGTSHKVTADIVLNAVWTQGVGPAKEEKTEEIAENVEEAMGKLEGKEVAQAAVTNIANSTTEAINNATDVEVVKDLSSFANNTISLVVDYADNEDMVKAINKVYQDDLVMIAAEKNENKRGSILKNCNGYLDALQYVDEEKKIENTYLDQAFYKINDEIKNYDPETQKNQIRLVGELSSGLQAYAVTLNNDAEGQKLYESAKGMLDAKNKDLLANIQEDDEASIELIGDTEADYLITKANLIEKKNYAKFVDEIGMNNINQLQKAVEGKFETKISSAEFNINRSLVDAFTKVDADSLDDTSVTEFEASYQTSVDMLEKASADFEGEVSEEGINQVTEMFQDSFEAFADAPDVETFGYLLSTFDGKGYVGLVYENAEFMLDAKIASDPVTDVRKETIINATKSAKKLAEAKKLQKREAGDYRLLYYSHNLVNKAIVMADQKGLLTSENEQYIADAFSVFTDATAVTNYNYDRYFDPNLAVGMVASLLGSNLPSSVLSYNSRMFYSINMGAAKINGINNKENVNAIVDGGVSAYTSVGPLIDIYLADRVDALPLLIDLLEKVFDDYTLSIYKNLNDKEQTLSIQMGLSKALLPVIMDKSDARIDEFESYFNIFDKLLSSFEKLEGKKDMFYLFTDYIGITSTGAYEEDCLLNYFLSNFNLMTKFETPVYENLTNKLSAETTEEQLKQYISDTSDAIEAIIPKK